MDQHYTKHEWLQPEGPPTHEYRLGIESIPEDRHRLIDPWISGFLGLASEDARSRLGDYLHSLRSKNLKPLTDLLNSLIPFSIIVHEKRAWLLLKSPTRLIDPSCYGNMVMIPAPHQNVPDLSREFRLSEQPDLEMLIWHFAGLHYDIPPQSGLLWPDQLGFATNYNLDHAPEWKKSLLLFLPGNGDVVVVNQAGRYAYLSHELPPGDEISIIGDAADFVRYLVSDINIVPDR